MEALNYNEHNVLKILIRQFITEVAR